MIKLRLDYCGTLKNNAECCSHYLRPLLPFRHNHTNYLGNNNLILYFMNIKFEVRLRQLWQFTTVFKVLQFMVSKP